MSLFAYMTETLLPDSGFTASGTVPDRITLNGRSLALRLSAAARRALAARTMPLDIEMELLFSCFVAKQLSFRDTASTEVAARSQLTDVVSVSYRVMLTRTCDSNMRTRRPDRETLPVAQPQRYVPKWLSLDFSQGAWRGEFGY